MIGVKQCPDPGYRHRGTEMNVENVGAVDLVNVGVDVSPDTHASKRRLQVIQRYIGGRTARNRDTPAQEDLRVLDDVSTATSAKPGWTIPGETSGTAV